MINKILGERYTILESIGIGGMAEVYLAYDKLLDRSVAIKILNSQFSNDINFIKQFNCEAQAAAKLSHANIINIYDIGCFETNYYIVMEYISGETLKSLINKFGPLYIDIAIKITIEIAEALDHAHCNNLVHCDIKPSNILINHEGKVKVVDFGIAKAVSKISINNENIIMGSMHYFSPEQMEGKNVNIRSDIYSLGVLLYEMVTGKLPFNGENHVNIAIKHLQGKPISPREYNLDISYFLESIILKAINKEPNNRYANAKEMINDLKLVQNYYRKDKTKLFPKKEFLKQIMYKIQNLNKDKPFYNSKNIKLPLGTQLGIKYFFKNKFKNLIWILGIFTIFFLFGGLYLTTGKFWSAKDIIIPNVIGETVDVAQNIMVSTNLRTRIFNEFNNNVASGHVISQIPAPGAVVKEQKMITLVVSKGAEIINLPDLKGLTQKEAEKQLENFGMILGIVSEQYSNDVITERVINQNPQSFSSVPKGTVVDLVISKGISVKKIKLPDFRGSLINVVQSQLKNLKLKQGNITEIIGDVATGTIISQSPMPSIEVSEGDAVNFLVAKNVINIEKKQEKIVIDVPKGSVKQLVQIIIFDNNGHRVIYEGVHKPDDRIEKNIEGIGPISFKVYIDGKLYEKAL